MSLLLSFPETTPKLKSAFSSSKRNKKSIKFNNNPIENTIELFPTFNRQTALAESKKKSKNRRAGFFEDERKIYPKHIVDKDNFHFCNLINEETGKPCNSFYGNEKSFNAHYSRKHNKYGNPNYLKTLLADEKKLLAQEIKLQNFDKNPILVYKEYNAVQLTLDLYSSIC